MIRTYTELSKFQTLEERFLYLKLSGRVGEDTFGYQRYLNQIFYGTKEWKKIRDYVILRDCGCELGVPGYDILGRIYIHHINPMTEEDILNREEWIRDPEFLICTSFEMHQAIHFGDQSILHRDPIIRTPNDTCPWR